MRFFGLLGSDEVLSKHKNALLFHTKQPRHTHFVWLK